MDQGGNSDLTGELWNAWQLSPRPLLSLLRYHSCGEQKNTVLHIFTGHRPFREPTDTHSGRPQMSDGPRLQSGFELSRLEARAIQFSLTLQSFFCRIPITSSMVG